MARNEYCCAFTCLSISLLVVILVSIPLFILPIVAYYDYSEHECNITNVIYPTTMPYNITDNWASCDCGRRCESIAPCVKLYSEAFPNKLIKNRIFVDKHSSCTFIDKNCKNGENPITMYDNLQNAITKAESYINQTTTCYYNSQVDEIYLDNNIDLIWKLIVVSLLAIGCLSTAICLIHYEFNKHKHTIPTKNQHIVETTV